MRLVLGKFARSGIEALPGRDLPTGVLAALRHYARGEGSDSQAPALPQLCGGHRLGRIGVDLDLSVDAETQEALERKAREAGELPVEQLAAHAVLAYLAEMDLIEEGPVTRQIR
jgi:hypothetical protein